MPSTSRHLTHRLRLGAAVAAGAAVVLVPATAAFAHIDPEPTAVEAGAEATVSFTVEHGCDASPTTKVEIQAPDGASGISGVDGGGFTSSVDGQVVTFTGGPLDADTPQAFAVTFTAPDEAGEVPVKIIQTCEEGSIDWIEVAAEGGEEPEHPAPILTITAGTPTGEEGGDHHAEETTETTEADHHAEESTETTEADHHAEEGEATETTATDTSESDDGGSSTPWVIGGVTVLAAAVFGFALAMRKKGGPSAGPDAGGDAPAA